MGKKLDKFFLILETLYRFASTYNINTKIWLVSSFWERWEKIDIKYAQKELSYLKRNKYITIGEKNGKTYCQLTSKGLFKLAKQKLQREKNIKLPDDNTQKIVLFDIPESMRKTRNKFRNYLKEFKFKELQKSVFIGSNYYEKELNILIDYLNIRKFVITGNFVMDVTNFKRSTF